MVFRIGINNMNSNVVPAQQCQLVEFLCNMILDCWFTTGITDSGIEIKKKTKAIKLASKAFSSLFPEFSLSHIPLLPSSLVCISYSKSDGY